MTDERRVVGTLHVDPDAPNTIVDGDRVLTWFDPAPEGAEQQVLGPEWKSVGHTIEAPMSLDAIRAFLGIDEGPIAPASLSFAMALSYLVCPVVEPVKRRGLTGKRYRIARRRYAREMRAYRRGLIPPVARSIYVPRARTEVMQEGIRGVSARFTVLDECSGPPWYDLGGDQ